MRFGHQAEQVQALQPYAAGAALAGGIQPEKRLAQLRQLVCGVAHFDNNLAGEVEQPR